MQGDPKAPVELCYSPPMMELTTVAVALDLVSKASKALDSLREQSKNSKDAALKEHISKLYDDFLDLKAVIVRLTEENANLKLKLAQQTEQPPKPEIEHVGKTSYYFLGDKGPFCQPCYDKEGKLVSLAPQQEYVGGTGRKCQVCGVVFFEEHKSRNSRGVRSRFGPWS